MNGRRLAARLSLGIALAAASWTCVLLLSGGFDTRLAGVRIKATDPFRPFVIAFTAILLFVAAVGEGETDAAMSRVLDSSQRLLSRLDHRLLAVILAVAVVAVGFRFGSKAAGGSDSYGYVSQAELWLNGHLSIDRPWVNQVPWPQPEQTFSPLGYHPAATGTTIVPSYSAGLPMLMALAKLIGGQPAIFGVVPLCGGLMVLATFGIGRRLAGSYTGLIAAWLLATSPPFVFMLVAPMSDLPAAAAWTVAFWCVTAGTLPAAMAGGLAAGIAVLIRPNLAPLVSIALLWFLLEARSNAATRHNYLWQGATFLMALLPGVLVTAALNKLWYGSPMTSGYGTFTSIFSLSRVPANLATYAVWLSQTQTPLAFLGIAALLVPASWIWSHGVRRSTLLVLGMFVVAVWLEYCAYLTFGAWWDLRFLLPTWGFMMIGTAVILLRVTGQDSVKVVQRSTPLIVSLVVLLAVILLGLHGVQFTIRQHSLDQQRWETKYPIAAAIVAARTDSNAVIFSGLHSGSLRYYAGRTTLAYASLDPTWLGRATAWLNAHGAHPYALLEEFEVKDFKTRFSSEIGPSKIDLTPSVFYDGPAKIYFFDLARAPGLAVAMETISDPTPEVRAVSPAPPPILVLR